MADTNAMPNDESLKVMVLAGGPDREREVSLMSGQTVTQGLRKAGHDVQQRDITPTDLTALDAFVTWQGDAIFPILHGSWGEGGGLQRILDELGEADMIDCDGGLTRVTSGSSGRVVGSSANCLEASEPNSHPSDVSAVLDLRTPLSD